MDKWIEQMDYQHVIFDFDGTIADTYERGMKIANQIFIEKGYDPKVIDLTSLYNMKLLEAIRKFKLTILVMPKIIRTTQKKMGEVMHEVPCVKDMLKVLMDLAKQKKLYIVTSNLKENVEKFLKHHKLQIFQEVYSKASIFSKNQAINRLIKKNQLSKKSVVYVGDERRDIDASRRSDIDVIAVTWGYNKKDILQKSNPDYLISHPKEILDIVIGKKK